MCLNVISIFKGLTSVQNYRISLLIWPVHSSLTGTDGLTPLLTLTRLHLSVSMSLKTREINEGFTTLLYGSLHKAHQFKVPQVLTWTNKVDNTSQEWCKIFQKTVLKVYRKNQLYRTNMDRTRKMVWNAKIKVHFTCEKCGMGYCVDSNITAPFYEGCSSFTVSVPSCELLRSLTYGILPLPWGLLIEKSCPYTESTPLPWNHVIGKSFPFLLPALPHSYLI